VPLICSPVGLRLPGRFGAGVGSAGVLVVSQRNVVWRIFVWAGGSGLRVVLLLGGFSLLSMAPPSQQNF
jgi:hypothetical protein